MAYTLKTSGLATALNFCLAVDSNGTTLKEFVSTDVDANKVIGTCTFGTGSWKGTTRFTFATGGSNFSPSGISFPSGHRATTADKDVGFFIAFAGTGGGSGNNGGRLIIDSSGGVAIGTDSTNNKVACYAGGITVLETASVHPTDVTTPWAFGLNYADSGESGYNTDGITFYYGLASGSIAVDSTLAAQPRGSGTDALSYVGGQVGNGTWSPNTHIICRFNRQLTSTEYTSLHTDWFGTLFDTGTVTARPGMLLLGAG